MLLRFLLLAAIVCRSVQAVMSPLVADSTCLDGCPLEPGQTSSCASDKGVSPSAEACQASCDATSYCSAITFHGPSTQEWANHCVFRIDGAFEPRACGTGCDHTTSNKTSGWVPGIPNSSVWLPSTLPWGKPKVFWFGANSSGLDNRDTLALIAKHAVGGYGWQTGHPGGGTIGTGEMLQASAATHLLDYLEEVGNNSTQIFEYRQIQVALRLFSMCALAADDPTNDNFWLHDPTTGELCLAGQPWGSSDPYWNFTNPGAADYWVKSVIGELSMDRALTSGRGAVFFDEVDQGECGYRGGNCDFAKFNATALQAAKIATYARQTAAMNVAGIVPIFSLDNRFAASGANTSTTLPCALPEDAMAAALKGMSWVRFYENWPNTFWAPGGVDLQASMVANAIIEAEQGIPNVLHSGGSCPAPPRNITIPGRLGGDVETEMGLYLTVAGPGTTLSMSGNWYDADFCWRPEFDVDFGAPLGPAVRTGAYTWVRNYTLSYVELDVRGGTQVYLL